MNILGIRFGHDSSAVLMSNGRLVADVAEERFARIKHFSGLPTESVSYCLEAGGIGSMDLDMIAVASNRGDPGINHLFRCESKPAAPKGEEHVPPLSFKQFPVSPRCQVVQVEHPLAHAVCAYYASRFRGKALIVTCDGLGGGVSVGVWRGENGIITALEKFPATGSVGWFYSNVTEALGWTHGEGEGITMGLAAYGDHAKCQGVLESFHPRYEAGRLARPHDF